MTNCIRTIPVWPFTWLQQRYYPLDHKPLEIDEREQVRRNGIKLDLESKISAMEQRLLEISKEIKGLDLKFKEKVDDQLKYMNNHNNEYNPVIQTETDAIWNEKQHKLQVYRRQTELLLQKKKRYSDIIELMHSHEVERDFLILSNELGLPNTDQVDDVSSTLTEIGTEVNMGIKTITTPSPLSSFMMASPSTGGFNSSPGSGGMPQTLDYDSIIQNAQASLSKYQAPLPPIGFKTPKPTVTTTTQTTTTNTTQQQQHTQVITTATKQPLVFQKLFKTQHTQG